MSEAAYEFEEEFVLPKDERDKGAYVSPLLRKAGGEGLTADSLSRFVTLMREGDEAKTALATAKGAKRIELAEKVRAGELAKEGALAAGLPLIRYIANKEWQRRQQWKSAISKDDITQDAIVGFYKGLAAYKPEAVRKSPTNYLGQWISTEIRRASEPMDHDLQVSHEAGARFRRVKALRSRLQCDLGRDPTDEEIAEASRNPAYQTKPGLVGRAPVDGEAPKVGPGLTISQVQQEREFRARVGHHTRIVAETSDGDTDREGGGVLSLDRAVIARNDDTDSNDPALIASEEDQSNTIRRLVTEAVNLIGLPSLQREMIARRYGLDPYTGEASVREISRAMGVHRDGVGKVITAFAAEMTRPGGAFHRVVANIPHEDLIAIGFDWVHPTLGPLPAQPWRRESVSPVLLERSATTTSSTPRTTAHAPGVTAWFECSFHDRVFASVYQKKSEVPRIHPCPSCGKGSVLVRTAVGD